MMRKDLELQPDDADAARYVVLLLEEKASAGCGQADRARINAETEQWRTSAAELLEKQQLAMQRATSQPEEDNNVKAAVDDWTVSAGITSGVILRSIKDLGRGVHAKSDLVGCQNKSRQLRSVLRSATRFAEDVREALSSSRWRTGADPISLGPCVHPDNGTVPGLQAAVPQRRQRSHWSQTGRAS